MRVWCLMSEQSDVNNYTSEINFYLPSCIIYYFDPSVEKKRVQYGKHIFLLAAHKVQFIATCGKKSIFATNRPKSALLCPLQVEQICFWPPSRKKTVCNTGETFILLVWLLTSLYSSIKHHTGKINFILPSCIIYYFDPPVENNRVQNGKHIFLLVGHKVQFIVPCREKNPFFLLAGLKVHFYTPWWSKKPLFSTSGP